MNLKINFKQKNRGISLIEVIIATSIITVSMISISIVYGNFVSLSVKNTDKIQATFLLDEGVEALKMIRYESWSKIASSTTNVDYYLVWENNKWNSTTTQIIIDNKFIRKYKVRNAYRDNNINLYESAAQGNIDDNSKIIDLSVSWNNGSTTEKNISFYIFNLN